MSAADVAALLNRAPPGGGGPQGDGDLAGLGLKKFEETRLRRAVAFAFADAFDAEEAAAGGEEPAEQEAGGPSC